VSKTGGRAGLTLSYSRSWQLPFPWGFHWSCLQRSAVPTGLPASGSPSHPGAGSCAAEAWLHLLLQGLWAARTRQTRRWLT